MKKYLKTPRVVCLATFFAMIQALLLGGCGQQTECENSIDTAMGTVISQTVYVTGNSPAATDGKTDEKDAELIQKYLIKDLTFDDYDENQYAIFVCDINGDKTPDIRDATEILKK